MNGNLNIKKALVIYHRSDYDGLFGGLVAKKALEERGYRVNTFGWTFGDPDPTTREWINCFDHIVLTDISLPSKDMSMLAESGKVLWIDHHQTALDQSISEGWDCIPGIRDIGPKAACELTWEYFYNSEAPKLIQYISSQDIWNKTRFDWENEVLPISYALQSRYGMAEKLIYPDLPELLGNENLLKDLIRCGLDIHNYMKRQWQSWIRNYSFEITVADRYKAIAILSPMFTSLQFSSIYDNYDACIVLNRKGDNFYTMSMYRELHKNKGFHCGRYLQSLFPGRAGGHEGAAGSQITEEEFMKILKEKRI